MLVLRWNQRAHYWFLGRPKGHIRGTKGQVPFGKGLVRTLLPTYAQSSPLYLLSTLRYMINYNRPSAAFLCGKLGRAWEQG